MKIYTKTGDTGKTSLYDGSRINKSDFIFDILGDIDELSTYIGMLIINIPETEKNIYRLIQYDLQNINSLFATKKIEKRNKLKQIDDIDIKKLENLIDRYESDNKPLKEFILPVFSHTDGYSHICRVISRRVERNIYKYIEFERIDEQYIYNIRIYMNRMSDLFFVFARWLSCCQDFTVSMLKY
jgi:cob(I)alamin adenosyltransferase